MLLQLYWKAYTGILKRINTLLNKLSTQWNTKSSVNLLSGSSTEPAGHDTDVTLRWRRRSARAMWRVWWRDARWHRRARGGQDVHVWRQPQRPPECLSSCLQKGKLLFNGFKCITEFINIDILILWFGYLTKPVTITTHTLI